MKKRLSDILCILFLTLSHQALSQDEFFHEIVLEKSFIENEQWELTGEANWKNLYDEPGWKRWGASLVGVRRLGAFRLSAGVNGYYTFNRSITNFFEFRPWMALQLNTSIAAGITLRQRLKSEWRMFFEEGSAAREDYNRLRYQLGVDFRLSGEEENSWRIRPSFEWYFIRDPATFERFPNERDYRLLLIKAFENDHEMWIGYQVEEFYRVQSERGKGHILLIGYSL